MEHFTFDIEKFKNRFGDVYAKYNIFFSKDYSKTTTYQIDDLVSSKINYITKCYKSLNNNNVGNELSDKNWWIPIPVNICISDNDILNVVNIVLKFCKDKFCPYDINNSVILQDIFYYLLGMFLYNERKHKNSGVVTSSSIDAMSISSQYSDFVIKYPLFNNFFGLQAYTLIRNYMTNIDLCSIKVIPNYSYNNSY